MFVSRHSYYFCDHSAPSVKEPDLTIFLLAIWQLRQLFLRRAVPFVKLCPCGNVNKRLNPPRKLSRPHREVPVLRRSMPAFYL